MINSGPVKGIPVQHHYVRYKLSSTHLNGSNINKTCNSAKGGLSCLQDGQLAIEVGCSMQLQSDGDPGTVNRVAKRIMQLECGAAWQQHSVLLTWAICYAAAVWESCGQSWVKLHRRPWIHLKQLSSHCQVREAGIAALSESVCSLQ